MQRIFYIFIVFVCLSINANSQGFDWQYSARMPAEYPDIYFGVFAEYSILSHEGGIDFFENAVFCRRFKNGSGKGISLGISAEYWMEGDAAVSGSISYKNALGSFKVKSVLPRVEEDFVSEYRFDSDFSYLCLQAGAKYRLFRSHFHAGAEVVIEYLFNNENEYSERIISPNDYFTTDPPTQERTIAEGSIADAESIIFYPAINLGYDFEYGRGHYSTIYFSAMFPLSDVIQNGNWKMWSFSFGIIIRRGFFF